MFINKHKKLVRAVCWILFGLYLVLMVYFLFFSEMLGRAGEGHTYHYNLTLFKEIKRFWRYRHQIGLRSVFLNLGGNILIFAPFGFLLPAMCRKMRGFFRVVLSGFGVSLAVECVQLYTKTGCFDVDDLLLNTIGCVIGVTVYLIVQRKLDRAAEGRRRK